MPEHHGRQALPVKQTTFNGYGKSPMSPSHRGSAAGNGRNSQPFLRRRNVGRSRSSPSSTVGSPFSNRPFWWRGSKVESKFCCSGAIYPSGSGSAMSSTGTAGGATGLSLKGVGFAGNARLSETAAAGCFFFTNPLGVKGLSAAGDTSCGSGGAAAEGPEARGRGNLAAGNVSRASPGVSGSAAAGVTGAGTVPGLDQANRVLPPACCGPA